jgi:hypothetical protein
MRSAKPTLSFNESKAVGNSIPIDASSAEKNLPKLQNIPGVRPAGNRPENLNPNNPAPGQPGHYGGYGSEFGNGWSQVPERYNDGAFASPDAGMYNEAPAHMLMPGQQPPPPPSFNMDKWTVNAQRNERDRARINLNPDATGGSWSGWLPSRTGDLY